MDRRLRLALVGAGAVAERHHIPALRELAPDVDLVAVADVDEARAHDFARRHRIAGVYTDTELLLTSERPDLVVICTGPDTHAELAVSALRNGAWVVCEKPPCTSLAELDRIEAVTQATGRHCSFVFQWRFGPGAQYVRDLIDRAVFDKPLLAQCHTTWFRDAAYYAAPGRGQWAGAGGPTLGLGIHGIDLLLWLLGDWSSVRATAARTDRSIETEDVSLAIVELANGALANVVTSVVSPREESYLRLDFQRATVELRHLYGFASADWQLSLRPGVDDPVLLEAWAGMPDDARSGHVAQLGEVVDCWRRGQPPPAGPRDVRRTVEFVTALYKSAITDSAVQRGSITTDDAFYRAMHGDHPAWPVGDR